MEYGLRQQIQTALVAPDAVTANIQFLTELAYIQNNLAFSRNLERIAADKGEAGWELGYVSDSFGCELYEEHLY